MNQAQRFASVMSNAGKPTDIREAFFALGLNHFRSIVAYDKPADHDEKGAPISLSLTTIDKDENGKPRSFSAAINNELYAVAEERLRGNVMEYVEGGNDAAPKGNQQLLPAFEELAAEKKIALYFFSAEDKDGNFSVTDKNGKPILLNAVLAYVGKFDIMSDEAAAALDAKMSKVKSSPKAEQPKPNTKSDKAGDAKGDDEIF